jgi:UDP-N-acetyl-alpha-D-quinovosamine dehydrogenase
MKILITGIDGFLGSHISGELAKHCHELFGISNAPNAAGPFEFHHVDLRRGSEVLDAFEKFRPELCIHLAAMAHADVGPEQEAQVRSVNVDGALNVFDACEAVGCNKLIFFSSVKVLADTTDLHGVDENDEPKPEGVYARLKREVELELLKRCENGSIEAAIVRPVAVIGPGDAKGNYARLIKMVRRGFFPLLERGEARRSIVFADRVAKRVSVMVDKGLVSGRTYVFSDGTFTLREIVDSIRSATGYSFCPTVPVGPLRSIGPLLDGLAARLKPGSAPFENNMKRLTSSFVVKTKNFEEDYGAMPTVDLLFEMRKACRPE